MSALGKTYVIAGVLIVSVLFLTPTIYAREIISLREEASGFLSHFYCRVKEVLGDECHKVFVVGNVSDPIEREVLLPFSYADGLRYDVYASETSETKKILTAETSLPTPQILHEILDLNRSTLQLLSSEVDRLENRIAGQADRIYDTQNTMLDSLQALTPGVSGQVLTWNAGAPVWLDASFVGGELVADYITTTSTTTDSTFASNISIASSSQYRIGGVGILTRQNNGAIIGGDLTGNVRGIKALDVQSDRSLITQVASGNGSVALGRYNTASGTIAIAIGIQNTASYEGAFAFGHANTASAYYASAFGNANTASAYQASALGFVNTASGTYSSAFGYSNTASGFYSSAFGHGNTASFNMASAFGYFNTASGFYTSGFGYDNQVSGENSSAFGTSNIVNTPDGTAFGAGNTASTYRASAFGRNNIANGTSSVAFGANNAASGRDSSAFGKSNTASGSRFVSAIGYGNTASTYSASAFGNRNTASGYSASAFGYGNTASGYYASVFGYGNTASSTYASAFGSDNKAYGQYSGTIGAENTASGYASYGIGQQNIANNTRAFAVGSLNTVTGLRSYTFGTLNTASGTDAYALGKNIVNGISNSLMIGPSNTAKLTILSSGNFGIGTTTPTAQLHTTGSVRFSNFGAGTLQTDANGNVSVSSDERLKVIENYYLATSSVEALLGIKPIQYHWATSTGYDTVTLYTGFSAQNVQTFIPEAVGEDGHGFLTLSDRPILATVVNAIKEIWERIIGLEDKVQEIDALQYRIEQLEDALDVTPTVVRNQQNTTPGPSEDINVDDDVSTTSPQATSSDGSIAPSPEVVVQDTVSSSTQPVQQTVDTVEESVELLEELPEVETVIQEPEIPAETEGENVVSG